MNTLQFLDLLKEIVDVTEINGIELTSRLLNYMKENDIRFECMSDFFTVLS